MKVGKTFIQIVDNEASPSLVVADEAISGASSQQKQRDMVGEKKKK